MFSYGGRLNSRARIFPQARRPFRNTYGAPEQRYWNRCLDRSLAEHLRSLDGLCPRPPTILFGRASTSVVDGQDNGEPRSTLLPGSGGFHGDRAAVSLYQLFGDPKAKAGAHCAFCREEWLEDAREGIRVNANAIVSESQRIRSGLRGGLPKSFGVGFTTGQEARLGFPQASRICFMSMRCA